MKFKMNIIEVADTGDCLKVKSQGQKIGEAEWQPIRVFNIEIPSTPTNCKAYYLGRNLEITVKVKQ